MREFTYAGDTWQVAIGDMGLAVGIGNADADVSQWEAVFTCVSDPSKRTTSGLVHDTDLTSVSNDALRRALGRALGK